MERHAVVPRVVLGLVLALLPLGLPSAQQRADDSFRVVNVRLFDGARVLEKAQVVIVMGRIQAIGSDLREWSRLRTIDGTGATLLPGFIDAHVHVQGADDLRQSLRFGVTTVLDMGATVEPGDLYALRQTAKTAADMADLRLAGMFAWSEASATAMAGTTLMNITVPPVKTVEEAKRLVDMRHAEGADHVKVGLSGVFSVMTGKPNLDEPRVSALAETAHRHGMLAVAHVENLDDVRMALASGIDGLMHMWRSGGTDPDVVRRLVERNVFIVPTLTVPAALMPQANAGLLEDRRLSGSLTAAISEHLRRPVAGPFPARSPAEVRALLDGQIAAVRNVHSAGATFVVGTDASHGIPVAFGISLHRELELLKEAGLRPGEILAAASANTADAFRLRDRGRIIPGRRADMLLVRGDATSDILATRDILRVWKTGVEVDRGPTERQR